jgi:ABC-type nitrate/sulfonate/bicarbonate transport system permease component
MGRDSFNMALVVAGIITVGLLGFSMTMIIEQIAKAVERGRVVTEEI